MLSCVMLAALIALAATDEVTFMNVTLFGGSRPVYIKSENNLRSQVPELTISRVSFGKDDSIPILYTDAIANLHQLEAIDLTDHYVEVIQRRALNHLPALNDLNLDDNLLKEIKTGVFNELKNLTRLSLRRNRIEIVAEGAFDNLHNLSFLLLGGNRLSGFDGAWFNEKPFLFVVDLVQNEIEEIPGGALEKYHQAIFLGDNRIQNLTRAMWGRGTRLSQLSLHDNQIEEWDDDLFDGISIGSFDVAYNQIECLNGSLPKLFAAGYTSVVGNPWDCDCISDIKKWSSESKVTVTVDFGDAECPKTDST